MQWFGEGDENTAFYHAAVTQRRRSNTIRMLLDGNGDMLDSRESIRDHILAYYVDLLGTRRDCREVEPQVFTRGANIGQQEGTRLLAPVTEKEIKNMLWAVGVRKAPGPDGYSSGFFSHNLACHRSLDLHGCKGIF